MRNLLHNNSFFMKKSIRVISVLAMLYLLVGCSSKQETMAKRVSEEFLLSIKDSNYAKAYTIYPKFKNFDDFYKPDIFSIKKTKLIGRSKVCVTVEFYNSRERKAIRLVLLYLEPITADHAIYRIYDSKGLVMSDLIVVDENLTDQENNPKLRDLKIYSDSSNKASQQNNTQDVISKDDQIVGKWNDLTPGFKGVITIIKKNGSFYFKEILTGSSKTYEKSLTFINKYGKSYFYIIGSEAGDYYLLKENGDLECYDNIGYISRANRIN